MFKTSTCYLPSNNANYFANIYVEQYHESQRQGTAARLGILMIGVQLDGMRSLHQIYHQSQNREIKGIDKRYQKQQSQTRKGT